MNPGNYMDQSPDAFRQSPVLIFRYDLADRLLILEDFLAKPGSLVVHLLPNFSVRL